MKFCLLWIVDPSADELKRIMMVHGGTFHTYLSHKTTHIIAKNLPDTKVIRLRKNTVNPLFKTPYNLSPDDNFTPTVWTNFLMMNNVVQSSKSY